MEPPTHHAVEAGGDGGIPVPSPLVEIDNALDDLRLWRLLLRIGLVFTVPVAMFFLGGLLRGGTGTGALEGLLADAGAMGYVLIVLRQFGQKISDLESDRAFRVAHPHLRQGTDGHEAVRPERLPGAPPN